MVRCEGWSLVVGTNRLFRSFGTTAGRRRGGGRCAPRHPHVQDVPEVVLLSVRSHLVAGGEVEPDGWPAIGKGDLAEPLLMVRVAHDELVAARGPATITLPAPRRRTATRPSRPNRSR